MCLISPYVLGVNFMIRTKVNIEKVVMNPMNKFLVREKLRKARKRTNF